METKTSNVELEFFVTGAKTYLDVKDAMDEFRNRVRKACDTVVLSVLSDINGACGLTMSRADVKDYVWNASRDECHIGRKLLLKTLGEKEGGLYFALVLRRENQKLITEARVILYRDNERAVPEFWDSFSRTSVPSFYRKGKLDCGVNRQLTDGELAEFDKAITQCALTFLSCLKAAGGIKP